MPLSILTLSIDAVSLPTGRSTATVARASVERRVTRKLSSVLIFLHTWPTRILNLVGTIRI